MEKDLCHVAQRAVLWALLTALLLDWMLFLVELQDLVTWSMDKS